MKILRFLVTAHSRYLRDGIRSEALDVELGQDAYEADDEEKEPFCRKRLRPKHSTPPWGLSTPRAPKELSPTFHDEFGHEINVISQMFSPYST